jgi:glycosyltransferase involved in cell wall biosynthesis
MPFIAFLDDDDQWLPSKLEHQVNLLSDAPKSVGLVYCWMQRVRDGAVDGVITSTQNGNIFEQALKRQPLSNASAWLVRNAVIDEIGGFDESLERGIDGDFLRRLCKSYQVSYIPKVLGKYHVEHGSDRITSQDKAGIKNAIDGQKIKLKKFRNELKSRPHIKASIYGKIAYRYAQLDEWDKCVHSLYNAAKSGPFSTKVYLEVFKVMYKFFQ